MHYCDCYTKLLYLVVWYLKAQEKPLGKGNACLGYIILGIQILPAVYSSYIHFYPFSLITNTFYILYKYNYLKSLSEYRKRQVIFLEFVLSHHTNLIQIYYHLVHRRIQMSFVPWDIESENTFLRKVVWLRRLGPHVSSNEKWFFIWRIFMDFTTMLAK